MSAPTRSTLTREQLQATKPRREEFDTYDEFDEAYCRWMEREGRSPLLARRAQLSKADELVAKQQRLLRLLLERGAPHDTN